VAGTTTITVPSSTATLATNENFTSTGIDDNATSTAITIDSSENVGIGTSSPSAKLHVAGETRIYPTSGTANLRFGENTTEKGKLAVDNTSNMVFETANAERMRIDSSGNMGLGVTPESSWGSDYTALQIGGTASLYTDTSATASTIFDLSHNAYFDGNNYRYLVTDEASRHRQQSGRHYFYVAPSGTADTAITWTTAMNINSIGNIGMGRDAAPSANTTLEIRATDNSSAAVMALDASSYSSGTVYLVRYRINDSTKGSVTSNGTSVAYNTSSDYRLKENVVPMTGSIDRLKALKPSRFNFIADPDTTVDGFLAHEAQEVVPEAITGEKDAMKTEEYEVTPAVKDENDNIITEAVMGTREVPDMQGIDQSKLVPLLVGAIQEQQTLIESLQADIAILKGATI